MRQNSFIRSMLLLVLSFISPMLVAETSLEITAEQWAIPRHGETVLQIEPVRTLIQQWQQDDSLIIEVSYPGGENGELWFAELKDWLIALGISSDKIKSIPGSGSKDKIILSLIKAGGVLE